MVDFGGVIPKKRQKKVAKTMLIDELDEEEPEPEVEGEAVNEAEAEVVVNVGVNVRLSPNSQSLLKKLNVFNAQKDKAAGEEGGDDVNKSTTSSSSSSEDEIDETERYKKVMSAAEKVKQKKRKRSDKDDDDDVYIPSQENVEDVQTPPSSGGRKKVGARKRVVTPKMKKPLKIVLKKKSTQETSKPTSPPPEPTPHQSPIHSPLHQSPPKQPTPPRQPSPLHLSPPHSPPHIHTVTPPQEQTLLTSQQIFQTPPPSQPHVQTTPGSSGYKNFPNIPLNMGMGLDEIGDFDFASNVQVKNVEKKVDDVVAENKRLADREKILEMHVKKAESDNKSLLKKIEADQSEIDILKVKVAELEEEKARRDEQNKYFELKNKELEAAKAMKEHELYMMNKVLENMLGKSIEQRFEEIEVEEVRAKRQAEIDAQMKDKGKSVESYVNAERSIVLATDPESPIQNPVPISSVSAIFEEDGGTGVTVTEASNEKNVDDYMNDDANEVLENADGEGENVND
ncbi:RNA-binding protein 33-like [Helianthus annuus]|uniref:RNA-binding protein 33-like n=1 Tax=Helianthus annuus TaxID=4232 RepID=UPI000B8FD246|nr:RNA-binding protein 33-like [Helianthus annuus]